MSKGDLDPRQNGPHPHDLYRFTMLYCAIALFQLLYTISNVFQLGRHSKRSASRVLVILPPHPIRDGEVRKGGYQKQYEVLVMGVFHHNVQGLSHN
jgi:hypothetical protein